MSYADSNAGWWSARTASEGLLFTLHIPRSLAEDHQGVINRCKLKSEGVQGRRSIYIYAFKIVCIYIFIWYIIYLYIYIYIITEMYVCIVYMCTIYRHVCIYYYYIAEVYVCIVCMWTIYRHVCIY